MYNYFESKVLFIVVEVNSIMVGENKKSGISSRDASDHAENP